MKRAIVRPPGASFVKAISSQGAPIDVVLAQAQHREYRAALAAAGVEVETLPSDERYPDSCFMQDPALVYEGQAVIGRMAAPSRRGEEAGAAEALAKRFPLAHIVEPGLLEGGDVMFLPDRVLVGRSARTNRAGIAQLAVALAASGKPVLETPTGNYLHLLTAAAYVGRNTVLALADFGEHPAFVGRDVITVPPDEAYAANVLGLGDSVIVPAGYPTVARLLRDRGFAVFETPVSEFAKADGGVTCLALLC
jgi:dimethylargininase